MKNKKIILEGERGKDKRKSKFSFHGNARNILLPQKIDSHCPPPSNQGIFKISYQKEFSYK